MARLSALVPAAFALLCLAACFDDTPASRDESYDQSCTVDSDCAVVAYASCGPCGSCGDLAINRQEQARFDADNVVSCPPSEPVACGACPELVATCTDGSCELLDCSADVESCR